jgi:uncharacterized membrane protein
MTSDSSPGSSVAARGVELGWLAAVLAAAVGMFATISQIVERIDLAENPEASLICDINTVISCSNVLTADQSSAFGIPNATIGLGVFGYVAGMAIAGLLGSVHSHRALWLLEGIALFMLGFTAWFLYQSSVNLSALCLYCLVIAVSVVVVNATALRRLYAAGALEGGRVRRSLAGYVEARADLIGWLGVVVVGGMLIAIALIFV